MTGVAENYKKRISVFFLEYGKVTVGAFLVVSIVMVGCAIYTKISPAYLQVSFLDIGQGDAILITTPTGHTMLVDGGPTDKILTQLEKKIGYTNHHIDVVVSTHPDADHVTGLIPVLAKYDVSTIVTSPALANTGVFSILSKSIEDEHAETYVGKSGDEINFGDGTVAYILFPNGKEKVQTKDTNSYSVSMVIKYGDESVLLTGDLPSTHEGELIQNTLPRNVTLYKAGHHGSKYSSGEALLSYIVPEYSVISAGAHNRYGHPNQEALDRLQKYSKEILSTIDKGSITFILDGTSASVTSEK